MIPGSVAKLVKRGHRVIVQRGAGEGASYPDELYTAVGAEIVADAAAVFAAAELIVKVKEPQVSEVALLKPHHILFTYLHLAYAAQINFLAFARIIAPLLGKKNSARARLAVVALGHLI